MLSMTPESERRREGGGGLARKDREKTNRRVGESRRGGKERNRCQHANFVEIRGFVLGPFNFPST